MPSPGGAAPCRPDGNDVGGPDDGNIVVGADDGGGGDGPGDDGSVVVADDGGGHGRGGGGPDAVVVPVPVVVVHRLRLLLLLLDGSLLNGLLLLGLRRGDGARLPVPRGLAGRVVDIVDPEPGAGVGRLPALAASGVGAERRGVAVCDAEARVEALLRASLGPFTQPLSASDMERGESSRRDAQRGGGAGGGGEGQEACCGEERRATKRRSHDFVFSFLGS